MSHVPLPIHNSSRSRPFASLFSLDFMAEEKKQPSSAPLPSGGARLHNKSGKETLTVLSYSHSKVVGYHAVLLTQLKRYEGLVQDSPCLIMSAADGRLTVSQVKVAYGYQIVAYMEFGRERLSLVTTSKNADDLLISHLCGTRNCCEKSHIVLETKRVNDERTHCHFCMRNAKASHAQNAVNKWNGVQLFLLAGCCPHQPQCGTRLQC